MCCDHEAFLQARQSTAPLDKFAEAKHHTASADSQQQAGNMKATDSESTGAMTDTQPVLSSNGVTHKQMQDSGYGEAFAKIMEGIPDHVKYHPSTQAAASGSEAESDSTDFRPDSPMMGHEHNSKVAAAVAAAIDKVAEQQRHHSVSLDDGQAYPEHVAQVPYHHASNLSLLVACCIGPSQSVHVCLSTDDYCAGCLAGDCISLLMQMQSDIGHS